MKLSPILAAGLVILVASAACAATAFPVEPHGVPALLSRLFGGDFGCDGGPFGIDLIDETDMSILLGEGVT